MPPKLMKKIQSIVNAFLLIQSILAQLVKQIIDATNMPAMPKDKQKLKSQWEVKKKY